MTFCLTFLKQDKIATYYLAKQRSNVTW